MPEPVLLPPFLPELVEAYDPEFPVRIWTFAKLEFGLEK